MGPDPCYNIFSVIDRGSKNSFNDIYQTIRAIIAQLINKKTSRDPQRESVPENAIVNSALERGQKPSARIWTGATGLLPNTQPAATSRIIYRKDDTIDSLVEVRS